MLDGHKVLELTRDKQKSERLFGDSTVKFELNLNHELLKIAVKNFEPDICIHLAAYLTSHDEYSEAKKLVASNIDFLIDLLDSLKESKIKLFINTGSFAEYRNGDKAFCPAYLYASTKTAARSIVDYYSNIYNFKYITVVPYTIYGGNDSKKKVIDLLFEAFESRTCLELTPGKQVLDFIHINDVVNFYLQLLKKVDEIEEKIEFELGTGCGISLRNLAQLIEDKSGKEANINWGGVPYRPNDIMYAVANLSFNADIGWAPQIDLVKGVDMLLKEKQKII
jgi:nucleoside-diphosphate-sugar epimerase